jgi:hypothetical protein
MMRMENLILEGEKSKIELGFLLTGFINKY